MAITAMYVTKTSFALTREEATQIVQHFQEILDDPKQVTTLALVFDPERFETKRTWAERDDVDCSFIAVE